MKAVVMAGGEGTRLRPLTCNLPKPMVPVVNKPVIEHIIELLVSHGIRDIVITLYYLPQEIVGYLGDGSRLGANITYSTENEPLGTAGSVKNVERLLDDTFLIISGDALTDFNLSEIIDYHKSSRSTATIALTRVENPLEFGVVITDSEERIRRFLEKPGWGEVFSDTINTGIYVLEPKVLQLMQPGKSYDFSKDLFPRLLHQEEPMFGHVAGGYWCDIGNLQQYRQAQDDALDGRVSVKIPGARVRHGIWIGEGTVIDPKAEIQGPAVIGRNCRIKERAAVHEYTVIADNCILEEGASVQRSVVWNNAYIGKKSKVSGAALARACTVKSNNLISEGAVIGDKCYVGSGAVVHPQVKIWPEKRIEPGANVSMSLVWGGKWPGSLFSSRGITGLANIELTPEFALKLGAAYGAALEKGCHVITSRDSHPASRMINRAIICGLISVGVNALDYRFMPTAVSRYGIKMAQAKGGVHVRISPKDPRAFLIEFYDAEGMNVDRGFERKIENIFFREDFRRTGMEEVGDIEFSPRAIDQYIEGFYENTDVAAIRRANLKLVIDYGFGSSALVLPHLLGKLGTDIVALNAYADPVRGRQSGGAFSKSLSELSNIVTSLQADLGMWIDVDGEKLAIIDEKGRVILGYQLLNLYLAAMLKYLGGGEVIVPVHAPLTVEKICKTFGGKARRTKSDARSLAESALSDKKAIFAADGEGGFMFPRFAPSFDAMYSFSKLLEVRSKTKEPLSKIVDQLPKFYLASGSVECSWSDKGRIMRRIIEEAKDEKVELVEGVKLHTDSTRWVLVTPDPSEPVLQVRAEAEGEKQAAELVRQYEQRIAGMKSAETEPAKSWSDITPAVESANMTENYRKSDPSVPPEKAFYFWSENHFLGLKASNLREFTKVLEEVEIASIRYHLHRGDFQTWVSDSLSEPALAQKLNRLDIGKNNEILRKEILRAVRESFR